MSLDGREVSFVKESSSEFEEAGSFLMVLADKFNAIRLRSIQDRQRLENSEEIASQNKITLLQLNCDVSRCAWLSDSARRILTLLSSRNRQVSLSRDQMKHIENSLLRESERTFVFANENPTTSPLIDFVIATWINSITS